MMFQLGCSRHMVSRIAPESTTKRNTGHSRFFWPAAEDLVDQIMTRKDPKEELVVFVFVSLRVALVKDMVNVVWQCFKQTLRGSRLAQC